MAYRKPLPKTQYALDDRAYSLLYDESARAEGRKTKLIETVLDNGEKLLNARVPGWRDRVDPEILTMWDVTRCILGQVFDRGFGAGMNELGLETGFPFGFDAVGAVSYEDLDIAWRARLAQQSKGEG
jgi:hypothetical protein